MTKTTVNFFGSIIPAAIGISIALILLITFNLWKGLESKTYDIRFQILKYFNVGKTKTTGKVVIVGMEEDKVIEKKPLIFWYPDIGNFLQKMRDYGVKIVGLDLIPVHSLGEKIKESASSILTQQEANKYDEFLTTFGEKANNSLLGSIIIAGELLP